MRAAVFIERDGILNKARIERQFQSPPKSYEEFEVNKEAIEPLQKLKMAGYLLIATTNQPGISRGYLPRREVDLMHQALFRAFPLDDLFMCPHDEMDRCPCRKPNPGLLREAVFKWKLNVDLSYVVSEKWQDAQAAGLIGCTSALIKSPCNGSGHYDILASSLENAVEKILQGQNATLFQTHVPQFA